MATPSVDRVTPPSGEVGHTVTIHGDNLRGTSLQVKFGAAAGADPKNPGNSGQHIKVTVPTRAPADPVEVAITVSVDGIAADVPAGPLKFAYSIPDPKPVISGIVPTQIDQNTGFVLTLNGGDFTKGGTPGRTPQQLLLFALSGTQPLTTTTNIVGTPTASQVQFFVPALAVAGDYKLVIGFSDGAGAEFAASGLVKAVATDPIITSYRAMVGGTTVQFVPEATPFSVEFTGTGFTNGAGRAPTFADVDPQANSGTGISGVSESRFVAAFDNGEFAGSYTLKVTFTEAGQSTIVSVSPPLVVV